MAALISPVFREEECITFRIMQSKKNFRSRGMDGSHGEKR
jgi:hypothetical protein